MTQERELMPKDKQPLVSVIMNCFNGEKYLCEAIDSVLAQTYQNWEIIFWDNQSTDRSAEIFKSYTDPRLHYFHAPTHALLYESRNYAIEKAKGEFCAFLDVDDWWESNKLEKQIHLFNDSDVGFVCSNYWIINERKSKRRRACKKLMSSGWVLDDLLKFYFVGMLTLVVRRSAFELLSYPFNPQYHIIGDFDLVIRLAVRWKLACVQEPMAYYRLHDNNETAKCRERHVRELNSWIKDMSKVKDVYSNANFNCVQEVSIYLAAIEQIFLGKRKAAYHLWQDLVSINLRFKLIAAILLPAIFIKKLMR